MGPDRVYIKDQTFQGDDDPNDEARPPQFRQQQPPARQTRARRGTGIGWDVPRRERGLLDAIWDGHATLGRSPTPPTGWIMGRDGVYIKDPDFQGDENPHDELYD